MGAKINGAIKLLQDMQPPEPYLLAFSGGKDSIVIKKLAEMAEINHDVSFQYTAEPPELVSFIKNYHPDVNIIYPPQSIWKLTETKGPPIRQGRWCCAEIKEKLGEGTYTITGVRRAESVKRQSRQEVEECYKKKRNTTFVNPIVAWSNDDVWDFIRDQKLDYCSLYDEGFKRLGCILCPIQTHKGRLRDIRRWPKMANLWRKAIIKSWDRQTPGCLNFDFGEDMYKWWISNKSVKQFDNEKNNLQLPLYFE